MNRLIAQKKELTPRRAIMLAPPSNLDASVQAEPVSDTVHFSVKIGSRFDPDGANQDQSKLLQGQQVISSHLIGGFSNDDDSQQRLDESYRAGTDLESPSPQMAGVLSPEMLSPRSGTPVKLIEISDPIRTTYIPKNLHTRGSNIAS